MNYPELIEQVAKWTGIQSQPAAERALLATVNALGSCLPYPDREHLAKHLPAELYAAWHAADYHTGQTATAVYAKVPTVERVPQPYATEHAQAVIRLLAAELEAEERELLARHLPDELGALVRDPRLSEGRAAYAATPPVPPESHGRTLATAAPGSHTPLSTTQPNRAQSGSVADWDEQRTDHTLAGGRDER